MQEWKEIVLVIWEIIQVGSAKNLIGEVNSNVTVAAYEFKMTQWTSFSPLGMTLQLHVWLHLEMPKA